MDKDTVFTPEDYFLSSAWASLVAQMVKNPPSMGETWLRSLGWEDPLEKEMAIHSSILAWRIPMDRGAWQAQSMGHKGSDTTEQLSTPAQRTSHTVMLRSVFTWMTVNQYTGSASTISYRGI